MKLIDNWRSAHKFWSTRFAGLTAVIAGMDWLLPSLSDTVPRWVFFVLALLILGACLVKQKGPDHGNDK